MFGEIMTAFLLQVLFTVGIIFLFGWLIALCNRRFYANFGSGSKTVCYLTGFIGTPVHELSHALFCLIFAHKIREIKLFQINSDDGTLGYVNHAYNKKNFYQNLGNFFIGVAPIVVISLLLYLFALWLIPPLGEAISATAGSVSLGDFGGAFMGLFSSLWTFFKLAITWQWWIFLLIGLFLCPHMTLSGADIKGAMSGLIFVLVAYLAVDIILGVIGVLSPFMSVFMIPMSYLLCFLVLSLIITLIALGISYIYRALSRKAR